jgi:hypothetical protein
MKELRTILFSMKVDAAPGPDGFTPLFFRANWHLVKDDMFSFLNDFHNGSADLERVNKSFLALLPKKAASQPRTTELSPSRTASPRSALRV